VALGQTRLAGEPSSRVRHRELAVDDLDRSWAITRPGVKTETAATAQVSRTKNVLRFRVFMARVVINFASIIVFLKLLQRYAGSVVKKKTAGPPCLIGATIRAVVLYRKIELRLYKLTFR
jgi:hypothetical protein